MNTSTQFAHVERRFKNPHNYLKEGIVALALRADISVGMGLVGFGIYYLLTFIPMTTWYTASACGFAGGAMVMGSVMIAYWKIPGSSGQAKKVSMNRIVGFSSGIGVLCGLWCIGMMFLMKIGPGDAANLLSAMPSISMMTVLMYVVVNKGGLFRAFSVTAIMWSADSQAFREIKKNEIESYDKNRTSTVIVDLVWGTGLVFCSIYVAWLGAVVPAVLVLMLLAYEDDVSVETYKDVE